MENKPNKTECRDCKHFFTPSCGCPSYCLEETVPYGEGCTLHQKRQKLSQSQYEENMLQHGVMVWTQEEREAIGMTPFGAGD